jgi:predicted transcriptional regulator of viral defense system
MMSNSTNYQRLLAIARSQHGLFTQSQAESCGYGTNLVAYHTRRGNFVRAHRGVYRLRDYPSSSFEHIVAAWLAVGREQAIVSHETALALHDLSDVIPNAVHLTVPRAKRNLPKIPDVRIHTTTRTLEPADIVTRLGIRMTSVARTIADSAEVGTAPEQVEMAIRQAIQRGVTTPRRLRVAASNRGQRVRQLIEQSLESDTP